MKIAVVFNRESQSVINLFGMPNKEKIGLKTIRRVTNALKDGGHQVIALEGDKDLVDRLEEFMPRVVKHERPGMVFNVSYGIQGQARYTHVPSILEMVGIPYVASGPLAHSLALDKVVTKMILRQHGIPTPDFAVLQSPDTPVPELQYPLIVKPKSEAVSFGLKVVHSEQEMREAVGVIYAEYQQPVLVEQYIEGREVNVGLLGNNPPEAFAPVELDFAGEGPRIYTYEDKTGRSGRTISHKCPAPIGPELTKQAQDIARQAFQAIGCYDCARVDMRLDKDDNLYILEINSLPSLGEHGSYLVGAQHAGLDFPAFINRLVEVASARYFGTPQPPALDRKSVDPTSGVFLFITQRRDGLERKLRDWVELSSHTNDPVGLREAVARAGRIMTDVGLKPVDYLTDERAAWTYQTSKGLDGGTLFILHLDVPREAEIPPQMFRREPELLYGEGIGTTRAPLIMLEYALRALRSIKQLAKKKVGVLFYTDEGRDARYSAKIIRDASSRAARVLVLRPGGSGDSVVTQRRGRRKYRFRVEDSPVRPGRASKKPETMLWVIEKLDAMSKLGSQKERVSVSTLDVRCERLPMLLPHRITTTLIVTFPDLKAADAVEERMRSAIGKRGPRWELEMISERPPMKERRSTGPLFKSLLEVAQEWDIPLSRITSTWPSVAGLVPAKTPCLCGVGPVARDVGTPQEAVQRISLIQRTLLLAGYLAHS